MTKLCTKCKQEKSKSDFSFRNKNKNTLQSMCKKCFSINDKGRIYFKTTNKEKKKERLNKIRNFLYNFLENNPCLLCGESDPRVLEFDHLDRKTKKYSISNMLRLGFGIENIKKEITKCRVLCANCHRKETIKQLGWWKNTFN